MSREDEAYDNWKDREADDHLGLYDDSDEAIERRAGATIDTTLLPFRQLSLPMKQPNTFMYPAPERVLYEAQWEPSGNEENH